MISRQTIYDGVVRVLREELLFDGELGQETPIKDLGLDSIQVMQLFVYIEESFQFEFTEGSLVEDIKDASLGRFVDYVHGSLVARGGVSTGTAAAS